MQHFFILPARNLQQPTSRAFTYHVISMQEWGLEAGVGKLGEGVNLVGIDPGKLKIWSAAVYNRRAELQRRQEDGRKFEHLEWTVQEYYSIMGFSKMHEFWTANRTRGIGGPQMQAYWSSSASWHRVGSAAAYQQYLLNLSKPPPLQEVSPCELLREYRVNRRQIYRVSWARDMRAASGADLMSNDIRRAQKTTFASWDRNNVPEVKNRMVPTIVAHGAALPTHIKGTRPTGNLRMYRALARRRGSQEPPCIVLPVDEFRTSVTCFACGSKMDTNSANKRLQLCKNTGCFCSRWPGVDRDQNAANNITILGMCELRGEERPAEFKRRAKDVELGGVVDEVHDA